MKTALLRSGKTENPQENEVHCNGWRPRITESAGEPRLHADLQKTAYKLLQEFAPLRKQFWGRHVWARGSFCCSSGGVTDQVIADYIANQGEPGPEDFRVEHGDF